MPNVLSIGCDPESLEDRHLLLREAGVFVTSVLGYAELKNLRLPVYSDVVLIGDDWPTCEIERLVSWAHDNAPRAMVVVLQKNGTTQTCEKCHYADANDPQDWLRLMAISSPSCSDAGLHSLLTEVSAGLKFAAIAEGKGKEAARMCAHAHSAYDYVARFIVCAALTQKEREEILTSLHKLEQRLRALGERF